MFYRVYPQKAMAFQIQINSNNLLLTLDIIRILQSSLDPVFCAELCIVEISICVCPVRCRNSGGILQSPSQFGKRGVHSNKILCCTCMFLLHQGLRGCQSRVFASLSLYFSMLTIRHEYYLTYTGKCGYISFC